MKLRDYFEILSVEDHVFRFRLHGALTDTVVDTLGPRIEQEYQAAIDSFGDTCFINFVDLRELKPLPAKAKAMVARLMDYGHKHCLFYSININPSALSKLTIKSAGQASHTNEMRAIVATEEEALRLLKEKKKELKRSNPPRSPR